MPQTGYRPEIGETVFVSLSGNIPIRITITGYRHHSYLDEEVMEFDRLSGRSDWATYKKQVFFPEIPVDTPYIYVVVRNEDREDQWCHSTDEAFFFAPDEAFACLAATENDEADFIVEVRKAT